jgi:hypothetical protein
LTAGYAGSRGINVGRIGDANYAEPQIVDGRAFYPDGVGRRNPIFGENRMRAPDADSFYHSLFLSVTRRPRAGFSYQASYTLSKAIDDASGTQTSSDFITEGGLPFRDRRMNRGLAAFDVRQAFSLNGVYQPPLGSTLSGLAAALVRNWQFSGVLTLAAGHPFSGLAADVSRDPAAEDPGRPDLVPGADTNPVLGGHDRYFDPAAFMLPTDGYYGDVGRNTIIGPGFISVDVGIVKSLKIKASDLQLRLELFNLLNRANFGVPDAQAIDSDGSIREAAGRITTTVSSARQMQLGVRLSF